MEINRVKSKDLNSNLVIWGASGHAKVIADIIELNGEFNIVGFIDNVNKDRKGEKFFGYR